MAQFGQCSAPPPKDGEMLAVTCKFINTQLRRMGQLHVASCCQENLHLPREGSSGTSKETSPQIRRQLVKHNPWSFRGFWGAKAAFWMAVGVCCPDGD